MAKKKKMPARPYYGELNVGETLPDQSAKKKLKKKPKKIIKPKPAVKPSAVMTASLGKKGIGNVKSAIKKHRDLEKSLLMN